MITSPSKWWDINKILSYNKLLNFVVGLRGGGKIVDNIVQIYYQNINILDAQLEHLVIDYFTI